MSLTPLELCLSREQAEELLDDPNTELVIHYSDGTEIVVRISESPEWLGENETVH